MKNTFSMTFDTPKWRLATNMEPLRGSVRGGALPPVGRFAPNRGLPRWNPYGVAAAQHGPCTKNAPFSSSSTLPVRPPAQHEPLWGSISPPPASLSLPRRTQHEPQRGSRPSQVFLSLATSINEPRRGSMLVAPGCPAGATGGHANKNLSNPVGVPYSPPRPLLPFPPIF